MTNRKARFVKEEADQSWMPSAPCARRVCNDEHSFQIHRGLERKRKAILTSIQVFNWPKRKAMFNCRNTRKGFSHSHA